VEEIDTMQATAKQARRLPLVLFNRVMLIAIISWVLALGSNTWNQIQCVQEYPTLSAYETMDVDEYLEDEFNTGADGLAGFQDRDELVHLSCANGRLVMASSYGPIFLFQAGKQQRFDVVEQLEKLGDVAKVTDAEIRNIHIRDDGSVLVLLPEKILVIGKGDEGTQLFGIRGSWNGRKLSPSLIASQGKDVVVWQETKGEVTVLRLRIVGDFFQPIAELFPKLGRLLRTHCNVPRANLGGFGNPREPADDYTAHPDTLPAMVVPHSMFLQDKSHVQGGFVLHLVAESFFLTTNGVDWHKRMCCKAKSSCAMGETLVGVDGSKLKVQKLVTD
jgi:hypothetical protein